MPDIQQSDHIAYGRTAYNNALKKGVIKEGALLIFVDFTLSSKVKRLWVLDSSGKVLFNTYVTHGAGSGGEYATRFSNINNSHQSSLGVMITAESYIGKHGLSRKIDGLEKGFNDKVRQRDIVIHGAVYIGDGKTGRSFGCFAIPQKEIKDFVTLIGKGSLLVAYYPDKEWLTKSEYLK